MSESVAVAMRQRRVELELNLVFMSPPIRGGDPEAQASLLAKMARDGLAALLKEYSGEITNMTIEVTSTYGAAVDDMQPITAIREKNE